MNEAAEPPSLVCVVGKTTLSYHLRCIEDLHTMLSEHADWMELGRRCSSISASSSSSTTRGTIEPEPR